MTFSMQVGFTVTGTINPLTGENPPKPSAAKLSNQNYVSADSTIATIVPQAANPNGFFITGVGTIPAGQTSISTTITATATATEPDGTTTEKIQGVFTLVLTAAPPPPPPPAASLGFTFDTPVPPPPGPPPAPGQTHA